MDEMPSPLEDDQSTESSSRRTNRARERHERRKARQQGMAYAAPASAPRQLRPAGSLKLPRIHIPRQLTNRLLIYGAAGIVFMMVVIFVLGRLKNDEPETGSNAIWIGPEWTYTARDSAEINGLTGRLHDHHIGTIYAWVGLLQPNNTWSDTTKFNTVEAFAQQLRQAYPEAEIFGWLSIGAEDIDGVNRLGDTNVQQIVADFSQRVVGDFGFDGVFLNIVPVLSGDENYIVMLRMVRASVGESASLAVAVPPDWTPTDTNIVLPPQIAPGTVWAEEFKQRVALLADQMTVSAYNSGLSNPVDYAAWVAYQVQVFSNAVADLETTTEILIGVPTYDAQPPIHDTEVENVSSAVQGIRDGLDGSADAATFVRGIAIYAEWETDDTEWAQIKALWSG